MSELDPDDYAEGSSISTKVTTYWLRGSSCFLSPSFSSAWGRFWAVHSMSFGTSTLALVVTFVDPSDRIDWSDGGSDGPVATFIGREERRPPVYPGLHDKHP